MSVVLPERRAARAREGGDSVGAVGRTAPLGDWAGFGGGPFPLLPTPDRYLPASRYPHTISIFFCLSARFSTMAELADKLAKGASELRFLLTQHKVADDIQGELYANGVDTVAKFAAAASDEADLKKMLKDSFSIDPTESLKLRAQAAGVVVAWKTAIS